jgi:hypothetical protein
MAATQRAAAKALQTAEAVLQQAQEPLDAPPKRGPGRPPKAAMSLEQVAQHVAVTRQEHERLAGQRTLVPQSLRGIGHADHCVDLERGGRRNGKRIAGDIQRHSATIRPVAQHEQLSERCLERLAKAERVVSTMRATIACVSGSVRQQVRPWDVAPPASYAMHAQLIPSYDLERGASTRTVTPGQSLRDVAERLRTPLFASGGVLEALRPVEPNQLQHKAQRLAEVLQRSSSTGEGRNGSLSRRHHQRRGLDHPRKRACLTAVHNFFLTRPDGTTAAERFFGQKPRSMFAAILGAVEIPPAPLRPRRRALE